jgi:hypothetical protein
MQTLIMRINSLLLQGTRIGTQDILGQTAYSSLPMAETAKVHPNQLIVIMH